MPLRPGSTLAHYQTNNDGKRVRKQIRQGSKSAKLKLDGRPRASELDRRRVITEAPEWLDSKEGVELDRR